MIVFLFSMLIFIQPEKSDTEYQSLQGTWKGECTQVGLGSYPMVFKVDKITDEEINGVIEWPTFKAKTKFKGKVGKSSTGTTYSKITEHELIEGDKEEIIIGCRYTGRMEKGELVGSWSGKGETGMFRVKKSSEQEK